MKEAVPAPRLPVRFDAEPRMRSASGVWVGEVGRLEGVEGVGKCEREKREKSG